MSARRLVFAVAALASCRAAPDTEAPEAELPAGTAFVVPHDSTIPDDSLGRSIRRGRALLLHTRDSLPDHVGNALTCTNCHLDVG